MKQGPPCKTMWPYAEVENRLRQLPPVPPPLHPSPRPERSHLWQAVDSLLYFLWDVHNQRCHGATLAPAVMPSHRRWKRFMVPCATPAQAVCSGLWIGPLICGMGGNHLNGSLNFLLLKIRQLSKSNDSNSLFNGQLGKKRMIQQYKHHKD